MLSAPITDCPGTGTYKFKFLDVDKNPATVDGLPTIVASDPTVVDQVGPVADNGDGTFSAPFHVAKKIGTSQLTITADVDLGEGVKTKDFVDVVSIIGGEAASIEGEFSAITPDPA